MYKFQTSRGQTTEGRRDRDATSRLGGMGECHKLPQRGPGQSPGRKRVFAYFRASKTYLIDTNLSFLTFLQHKFTMGNGRCLLNFDELGRPRGPDRNAWRAGLWPAGRMLDKPDVDCT